MRRLGSYFGASVVLVGAALGLAVTASVLATEARAADDVEFKYGGDFRVRYFNDLNASGADDSQQSQDSTGRFKFTTSARRGESLQAFLGVVHSSLFGAENGARGTYTSNRALNLLLVNRAWGWWKATDSLSLKVGRFGLELADGSIFSENDWDEIPTAHEGVAAMWDWEFARLALIAVKANELSATGATGDPNSDPERNFYIASADIKNSPEFVKIANLHFIQLTKDATGNDTSVPPAPPGGLPLGSQNFLQYGITLGGDYYGFLYKGTLSFQNGTWNRQPAGTDAKINSSMYDLMLGYSWPDFYGVKLSAGYHSDSGDDDLSPGGAANDQSGYQAAYYDHHNYAGLMDVLDWGNLTYWNVNLSFVPVEDFEIGAGYYKFSRTTSDGSATLDTRGRFTSTGRLSVLPTAVDETDKDLGSEVDLFGNRAYDSGGIKLGARLSMFLPGGYFKNGEAARGKTLVQAMAQGSVSF